MLNEPMPKVGRVKCHYLDSGSFTLWTKAAKYAEQTGNAVWDFYETDEFRNYLELYVEFINRYHYAIDFYSNVDVIPDRQDKKNRDVWPQLSYNNLKWLEDMGMKPVPVVHYTNDLQWLERYIEEGYEFIALGGLVGSTKFENCRWWLDKAFEIVCDSADKFPRVKIHGFGITTFPMLFRYPWWSVDSTTWTKVGAYGGVIKPRKKGREYVYNPIASRDMPEIVKISMESPEANKDKKHFRNYSKRRRREVLEWLEMIDVPLGQLNKDGSIKTYGVYTHHTHRREANLKFFEILRKHIWWPRAHERKAELRFISNHTLTGAEPSSDYNYDHDQPQENLRIFYSGEGSRSNPEIVLQDEANLMLTFHDFYKRFRDGRARPSKRFRAILKKRRPQKAKARHK